MSQRKLYSSPPSAALAADPHFPPTFFPQWLPGLTAGASPPTNTFRDWKYLPLFVRPIASIQISNTLTSRRGGSELVTAAGAEIGGRGEWGRGHWVTDICPRAVRGW